MDNKLEQIKEARQLTDEQMSNTKKYKVTTNYGNGYENAPEIQYSGRGLSDIVKSLNTDHYVYLGNKLYKVSNIVSIERMEK